MDAFESQRRELDEAKALVQELRKTCKESRKESEQEKKKFKKLQSQTVPLHDYTSLQVSALVMPAPHC